MTDLKRAVRDSRRLADKTKGDYRYWRIMSVTGHTMRADVAAILNTYTKDVDAEADPVGSHLPSLL